MRVEAEGGGNGIGRAKDEGFCLHGLSCGVGGVWDNGIGVFAHGLDALVFEGGFLHGCGHGLRLGIAVAVAQHVVVQFVDVDIRCCLALGGSCPADGGTAAVALHGEVGHGHGIALAHIDARAVAVATSHVVAGNHLVSVIATLSDVVVGPCLVSADDGVHDRIDQFVLAEHQHIVKVFECASAAKGLVGVVPAEGGGECTGLATGDGEVLHLGRCAGLGRGEGD